MGRAERETAERKAVVYGGSMMKKKENAIKTIHILCVAAAVVVALPLLILGHFDYPSADDWSLGKLTSQAVRDGEGIVGVLKQAVNSVLLWREKGEPRFSAAFLGTLQPGIWGEHFYRITPWLMIGSLFFSEILLCSYLFRGEGTKKMVLPVVIPSLALQLLCVPYPVESFYWYVGGVNYTFAFSLSLILLYLFLRLKDGNLKRGKTVLYMILGGFLAVVVGGNNYSASLSSACVFVSLSFLLLFRDRRAFVRNLPITVLETAALVLCLVAPGNQIRLNDEFGGTTTGAVYAVSMSLWRSLTNIYSWTTVKILIMMVLIAPFLWKAMRRLPFSFRYPAVFTLYTFGIYASQIVATMYVDGSTGGRRMADILYYGYHVWLLLNEGYWIGWIQRRRWTEENPVLSRMRNWLMPRLVLWFCVVGVILAGVLGVVELKTLSTYRACVWLVKGYASEYAQAWEERLEVLKDDSVKTVYFDPLPGYEELIFYTDLKYGENWVNKACAEYYDKEYVGLK